MTTFHSGYCAIVGRPNAGKSTLLNFLCGDLVSIVSDKPQTSRDAVTGIRTTGDFQIAFVDTPGAHKSKKPLNVKMAREAEDAAEGADVILMLCDPLRDNSAAELRVAKSFSSSGKPLLVAINKIDAIRKESLLPTIKFWADAGITDVFPISARTGEGVGELERAVASKLPEGPALFPGDLVTDQNEKFLASEIIRSKILELTRHEIPYSTMVGVEEYKERSERLTAVRASIYVEKDSQKGILIGAGGSMIKKIGQSAREELEKRFDRKFYLELSVKTRKDWTKDALFIKRAESDRKG